MIAGGQGGHFARGFRCNATRRTIRSRLGSRVCCQSGECRINQERPFARGARQGPTAIATLVDNSRKFALTILAFLAIILVIHFSKSDIVAIKTPLLLGVVLWAPFLVGDESAAAPQKMSRLLAIGSAVALAVHVTWFAISWFCQTIIY
jgi:hypothetical protein